MGINQRIKYLRKSVLKITQEDFAKKISLSRSNVGNIETGQINITDRVINNICDCFNVNPDWLINGTGEIFAETSDDFVQRIKNEYDLDDLDVMITKRYLELSKEERQSFRNILLKLVNGQVDISQLPEPKMTVEQAEAEYIKNLSASAKKTTSSVSNTTTEDNEIVQNKVKPL